MFDNELSVFITPPNYPYSLSSQNCTQALLYNATTLQYQPIIFAHKILLDNEIVRRATSVTEFLVLFTRNARNANSSGRCPTPSAE